MITSLKNTLAISLLATLLSLVAASTTLAASEEFENEANDEINLAEKLINDLTSMIRDAADEGMFVSYYEDDLDDAQDFLTEALEQKEDEDWEDALEYAEKATDIL